MPDLRPPLDPIFAAFGEALTATVTPPDENPIAGVGVILGTLNAEFPAGADFTVTETRRTAAFRRSQVPSLPYGTRIDLGTEELTVERVLDDDGEMVRVLVR